MWEQQIVIAEQRPDLGLGGCPLVSLADDRRLTTDNRPVAGSGGEIWLSRSRRTSLRSCLASPRFDRTTKCRRNAAREPFLDVA